jgi:hypothetical protein
MSLHKLSLTGLPLHLHDQVLWVAKRFRTNSLSLKPGGSGVIVCYHQGKVLGYNNIKHPISYIKAIWDEDITKIYLDYNNWDEDDQLEEFKKHIKCIYAENTDKDSDNYGKYQKIWDCNTSNKLPWESSKRTEKKSTGNWKPYSYSSYKKYGYKKKYRGA